MASMWPYDACEICPLGHNERNLAQFRAVAVVRDDNTVVMKSIRSVRNYQCMQRNAELQLERPDSRQPSSHVQAAQSHSAADEPINRRRYDIGAQSECALGLHAVLIHGD